MKLEHLIRYYKHGWLPAYVKWILKYLLKGDWVLGAEMAYWENRLRRRSKDWTEPMFKDVYAALDMIRLTFDEYPVILELGPGPRSRLTEGYIKKLYGLVAVDPLAEEYKKHFHGKSFLIQGTGERLNKLFLPETFHMAYASQVLDHVQDPARCFHNLYDLVKVDGLIMVQGSVNEGTRMGWATSHRHDISPNSDGDLILKNKKGDRVVMNGDLALEVVATRWDTLVKHPWFSITYRKC